MILLDAGRRRRSSPTGANPETKARARLQKMGVEIQLGARVVDVDREGLTVKDSDGTTRRIESACKVWSAGVSASPLGKQIAEQAGAEVDRAGRIKVLPDFTVPGLSNVFVIGDMASVPGVPGIAQGAIQGASTPPGHQRRAQGCTPACPRTVQLFRQGLRSHPGLHDGHERGQIDAASPESRQRSVHNMRGTARLPILRRSSFAVGHSDSGFRVGPHEESASPSDSPEKVRALEVPGSAALVCRLGFARQVQPQAMLPVRSALIVPHRLRRVLRGSSGSGTSEVRGIQSVLLGSAVAPSPGPAEPAP